MHARQPTQIQTMPRKGIVELILPYPPSLNSYYRVYKNRILISKKGRAYRQEVIAIVAMQRLKRFDDSRLIMSVLLNPPDNRRRDLDNALKAVADALEHAGLYNNDGQIDKLTIERGDVVKHGCMIVRIAVI